MAENLRPFQLINKKTEEPLTHKQILEMAKEKGFFENEFKGYNVMLKDNGTPIIFGYTPLVSFALNSEEYALKWIW